MNYLTPVILIAIVGGVAVTLQAQFMGLMDRSLGTLESMFITYGSGGLVIAMAVLVARGARLPALGGVPWWTLTAGLIGLVIVGSIGFAVPRLGLVAALTIVVAAEFISGALINHFGWFGAAPQPMDWTRLAGIGLLLGGTWLVLRPA
jgi:transporter family-2 protein